MRSNRLVLTATTIGILSLAAPGARASGLDAPQVGSAQSSPTAVDPAAVWWNPAELAFISRPDLLAGAGLVIGHIGYTRERLATYQTSDTLKLQVPTDPQYLDPSKTGTAPSVSATPIAPFGDIFAAGPAIPGKLVLGAGIYAPYAALAHFPERGAQAWQLQQALILATYVTVSAAARLRDNLSVGAGISYVLGYGEISRLQDFGAIDTFARGLGNLGQKNDFGHAAPPGVRELDVLSRPFSITHAFSHSASFNVGVAWRPTPAVGLALVYQHGSDMRYKGHFALDMSDDFFTRDLAPAGLKYKPLVEGDGEIRFSLPRRLTLGASWDANEKLRVDGFVSCIFYSDLDEFTVIVKSPDLAQPKLGIGDTTVVTLPRAWHDTVWVEANARYRISRKLLVSVTAGYQSPAAPARTIDVASPDGHRLIGGAGGVLSVSQKVSLLGDVRLQGIIPRTVTESDYDLANGTYRLFLASASGHIRVRF